MSESPPTQGEEAIELGAKALVRYRGFGGWESKTETSRQVLRDEAQAVLSAAYPQQTEGDGREWTISGKRVANTADQALTGDYRLRTVISLPDLAEGEAVTVVPKSSLTVAEQRAEEAERAAGYQAKRAEAAKADKDRLQREVVEAKRRSGEVCPACGFVRASAEE